MNYQNTIVDDLARVFQEFGTNYYKVHYKPTEDKRIQQETIKTLEKFKNNDKGLQEYLLKKNKLQMKQEKLNSENLELNKQNQNLRNALNSSNNELIRKNLQLNQKIEQQSIKINALLENERLTRNQSSVINRLVPGQPLVPISNPTQIISYNSEESERLKEKIKELENQISGLVARQEPSNSNLLEINTLKEELKQLKEKQKKCINEEEKNQLQQEKNQLVQEKTTLQEEKTTLQQEKNQLEQEKTNLQEEKNQLVQEKATLEQENNDLKNSLTNRLGQNNQETIANERIQQLANENTNLRNEKEILEQNMVELNSQINPLNERVQIMNTNNINLKENLIKLTELNENSFKKLNEISKEIINIDKIMNEEQLLDESSNFMEPVIDLFKIQIDQKFIKSYQNLNEEALLLYITQKLQNDNETEWENDLKIKYNNIKGKDEHKDVLKENEKFNFFKVVEIIIKEFNTNKDEVFKVFAKGVSVETDENKEIEIIGKIYDYYKKLERQAGGAENKKQPEKRLNMAAIEKAVNQLQSLQEKYKDGDINEIKSIVKEANEKVEQLKKDAIQVEVQRTIKSKLIKDKDENLQKLKKNEAEQQRKQEEEKKRKEEEAARKKKEEDKRKKKEEKRIKSIRVDYDDNIEKIKSNLKKLKEFSILCEQLTYKKITLENLANCQEIEKEIERDINDYDNNNFDYLKIKTFSKLNQKLESKIKNLQEIKKEDDAKKKKIAEEEEERKIKQAQDETKKAEEIYEKIFIELGLKLKKITNEKERKELNKEYNTINITHTESKNAAKKEKTKLNIEIKIKEAYKKGIEEYKKLKSKIEESIEEAKKQAAAKKAKRDKMNKEAEEKAAEEKRKRKEEEERKIKEEKDKRIAKELRKVKDEYIKSNNEFKAVNKDTLKLIKNLVDTKKYNAIMEEHEIAKSKKNAKGEKDEYSNTIKANAVAISKLKELERKIKKKEEKQFIEEKKVLIGQFKFIENMVKKTKMKLITMYSLDKIYIEESIKKIEDKIKSERAKKFNSLKVIGEIMTALEDRENELEKLILIVEIRDLNKKINTALSKLKSIDSIDDSNELLEKKLNLNEGLENKVEDLKQIIVNNKNLLKEINYAIKKEQQKAAQQKAEREKAEREKAELEKQQRLAEQKRAAEQKILPRPRKKAPTLNETLKKERDKLLKEVLKFGYNKDEIIRNIKDDKLADKIAKLKGFKEQALKEQALDEAKKDLPRGWDAAFDKDSGKIFYYNETTKQYQWEKPGQQRTSSPRINQFRANNPQLQQQRQQQQQRIICKKGGNSIEEAILKFSNTNFYLPDWTPIYVNRRLERVQSFFREDLIPYVNKYSLEYLNCDEENERYYLKNIIVYICRQQIEVLKDEAKKTGAGAIYKGLKIFKKAFKKLISNITNLKGKPLEVSQIKKFLKKFNRNIDDQKFTDLYQEGEVTETNILDNQSSSELLTDSSEISSSVKIKKQKGGGKRKKIKGSDKINKLKYKLYKKLVDKNLI